MDGTASSDLTLEEAVPLGYALCDRVARQVGCRALAIKGPTLYAHGLRARRTSIDVDVWVDPQSVDRFRAALEAMGWFVNAPSTTAQILPLHSEPYRHEHWPCEIDVHERFPGFLAEPQVVFDTMWQHRKSLSLAAVETTSLDLVGSAAIAALHVLRDPFTRQHEVEDTIGAICERMSTSEARRFASLAEATGAARTLAPVLDALGVDAPGTGVNAGALMEWHLRTQSSGQQSVAWAHELLRTPVQRWPRLLSRAVLLTEAEIRTLYPEEAAGWKGLARGRLRRLVTGLRTVPAALVLLWRQRNPR